MSTVSGTVQDAKSGLRVSNPSVAECAVFGIENDLKGQVPLALVVLKSGDYVSNFELEYNIVQEVRKQLTK